MHGIRTAYITRNIILRIIIHIIIIIYMTSFGSTLYVPSPDHTHRSKPSGVGTMPLKKEWVQQYDHELGYWTGGKRGVGQLETLTNFGLKLLYSALPSSAAVQFYAILLFVRMRINRHVTCHRMSARQP